MDPASVFGLVTGGLSTAYKIFDFFKKVAEAERQVEAYKRELNWLKDYLDQIDLSILKDRHVQDFRALEEEGHALSRKLDNEHAKGKWHGKLKWSMVRQDVIDTISHLEAFRNTIHMIYIRNADEERSNNDRRTELAGWLSPMTSAHRHDSLRSHSCTDDPGKWVLDSLAFKTWKTGGTGESAENQKPSFLWLRGIAGSGKSFLASTIINRLQNEINESKGGKRAVVYFYFEFIKEETTRYMNMLLSIMWQLLQESPNPKDVLKDLEGLRTVHNRPSRDNLLRFIRKLLQTLDEAYLVIDALDECDDDELFRALEEIASWTGMKSTKILLTSRNYENIEMPLKKFMARSSMLDIGKSQGHDICEYIDSKLRHFRFVKYAPNEECKKIVKQKLMEKAGGMFRWVECQFSMLRKYDKREVDEARLYKILDELPETLDETYERCLSSVDEDYMMETRCLLRWLTFYQRPMKLSELAPATSIVKQGDTVLPKFDTASTYSDPRFILGFCPGLIDIMMDADLENSEDPIVRLAHFSVKEYLISTTIQSSSVSFYALKDRSAHGILAGICLAYLSQFMPPNAHPIDQDTPNKFPFTPYATEFWPWHALQAGMAIDTETWPSVTENIQHLLQDEQCYLAWYKLWDFKKLTPDFNVSADSIPSPLFFATRFGLKHHVATLIRGGMDINTTKGGCDTPVKTAAGYGHYDTLVWLLDSGADFRNADDIMAFALRGRHCREAFLILDREEKAALAHREGYSWPADHYNALLQACQSSISEAFDRLTKAGGTDVCQDNGDPWSCRYLLEVAAINNNVLQIERLLELGAKIDQEGGWYGTALRGAALQGQADAARTLVERGANLYLTGPSPATPLCCAISFDRKPIFDMLLKKGHNVNHNEQAEGCALQVAATKGDIYYVRELLNCKADVNQAGGLYHTALQAAAACEHEEIVYELLKHGAKPNVDWCERAEVLQIRNCSNDSMILVRSKNNGLERDDWNVVRGDSNQKNNAVMELFSGDVVITRQQGEYGTALNAAVCKQNINIIKALLEKGADVNDSGGGLFTPLQQADAGGNAEIRSLLRRYTTLSFSTRHRPNTCRSKYLVFDSCNEETARRKMGGADVSWGPAVSRAKGNRSLYTRFHQLAVRQNKGKLDRVKRIHIGGWLGKNEPMKFILDGDLDPMQSE